MKEMGYNLNLSWSRMSLKCTAGKWNTDCLTVSVDDADCIHFVDFLCSIVRILSCETSVCARVCMCASGNTLHAVEIHVLDPPRTDRAQALLSVTYRIYSYTLTLLGPLPSKPKPSIHDDIAVANQLSTVTQWQVFGLKPSKHRLVTDHFLCCGYTVNLSMHI